MLALFMFLFHLHLLIVAENLSRNDYGTLVLYLYLLFIKCYSLFWVNTM